MTSSDGSKMSALEASSPSIKVRGSLTLPLSQSLWFMTLPFFSIPLFLFLSFWIGSCYVNSWLPNHDFFLPTSGTLALQTCLITSGSSFQDVFCETIWPSTHQLSPYEPVCTHVAIYSGLQQENKVYDKEMSDKPLPCTKAFSHSIYYFNLILSINRNSTYNCLL